MKTFGLCEFFYVIGYSLRNLKTPGVHWLWAAPVHQEIERRDLEKLGRLWKMKAALRAVRCC